LPGNYRIEVDAHGFQKVQVTTARLDIDATLRQNFRLQPGTVQQQIIVSAESQMVQTDNATSGEVVSGKLIDDLPISGRDFTNLLGNPPAVTQLQVRSQLYCAQHGLPKDFIFV